MRNVIQRAAELVFGTLACALTLFILYGWILLALLALLNPGR